MKYCHRCLQPDTRPGIKFDREGVCPACRYHESLQSADWAARQAELQELVTWGKSMASGVHDCIIGVSGGKDSLRQAIFVKEVLNMNPLLVCLSYPPEQVTQRGVDNLTNLLNRGFDCVTIQPAPDIWRKLMRKSFLSYANWAKSTELALFSSVPRIAIAYQIPLIWWGENAALQLGDLNVMGRAGWDGNNLRKMNTLADGDYNWMLGEQVSEEMILQYKYPSEEEMEKSHLQVAFLGYFWRVWSLRDNGAYASLNGLSIRNDPPSVIGDTTGVTSLDEDWVTLNQMIKYLKFGFGRVTDYLNEDIRNGRISREDAVMLAQKYDGACDARYVDGFCEYIDISVKKFWGVVDASVNKKLFRRISEGKYEPKFSVGLGYDEIRHS